MTTDFKNLTPWQRRLARLGFSEFRWFRRWVGGTWFRRCSLGYALKHMVLIKDPNAYITEGFWVVTGIERYGVKQ